MKGAIKARCQASMIRISIPYLSGVFTALENVDLVKDTESVMDGWFRLFEVQQQVETLLNQSVFATALRSSRLPAQTFLDAVKAILSEQDLTSQVGPAKIWTLKFQRDQFRTALLAELGVLPTYFVSQKEGFDTLTLLDNGQALFPASLVTKVPEARFDAAETGKALAFELATAVGFHVFRALEAVLRRYYSEVTKGAPPPKVRSIGVYVRAMRGLNAGDPKILAALDQIRDLHRNPLIHPEAVLTMDAAVSLVGIARSAIGAMLNELPDAPLTTSSLAGLFSATTP